MPIKYQISATLFFCLVFFAAEGQSDQQPAHLTRIYEDNDFINIAGDATDKGYTNGTRLDFYFSKGHPSKFFLDRWFPRAGRGAVNTFSYSLEQVMIVPTDISQPDPDKNDWPYSGALVLSHGMYSTNPVQRWAVQTQITGGVIGPAALAKQTQTWVHSTLGFVKPMGWDKQMPNDVLLNLDVQAEKMIWQTGSSVELMAGAEAQAGSMFDGAALHLQLRIGKMRPYFDSYYASYATSKGERRGRIQYYILLKPAIQWWAYDALLEGGIFSGKSDYYAGIGSNGKSPSLRRVTATADIAFYLIMGRISLSLTQTQMSPLIHDVSGQSIGNISATYSW